MSDAICFTGASNNGTHLIKSATTTLQSVSVSGYQDKDAVLIAIDISTTTIITRHSNCVVIEKGENSRDTVVNAGSYTAVARVEFSLSGTVTCTWIGSTPAQTKIIVIGF